MTGDAMFKFTTQLAMWLWTVSQWSTCYNDRDRLLQIDIDRSLSSPLVTWRDLRRAWRSVRSASSCLDWTWTIWTSSSRCWEVGRWSSA